MYCVKVCFVTFPSFNKRIHCPLWFIIWLLHNNSKLTKISYSNWNQMNSKHIEHRPTTLCQKPNFSYFLYVFCYPNSKNIFVFDNLNSGQCSFITNWVHVECWKVYWTIVNLVLLVHLSYLPKEIWIRNLLVLGFSL